MQAQRSNVGKASGTCVWASSRENHVRPRLSAPGSGYGALERWNLVSNTTKHPNTWPDPVSDTSPDIEVPGGHLKLQLDVRMRRGSLLSAVTLYTISCDVLCPSHHRASHTHPPARSFSLLSDSALRDTTAIRLPVHPPVAFECVCLGAALNPLGHL